MLAALGYLSANIYSGIIVLAVIVDKLDHVLLPIASGSFVSVIGAALAYAFSRILRLPNASDPLWILVGGIVGLGVSTLQFAFCAPYLVFS